MMGGNKILDLVGLLRSVLNFWGFTHYYQSKYYKLCIDDSGQYNSLITFLSKFLSYQNI